MSAMFSHQSVGEAEVSNAVGSPTVSLKSLPAQHDIQVSLPLGEDIYDTELGARIPDTWMCALCNCENMQELKYEIVSYWNLTVTILRAKNNHSHDYWSESDCYVTLHLPTASATTYRTKCVDNSSTPEWNESFHFRVHSHVKNILEMRLYDADTVTKDDLCSIMLVDISNLTPGKKETKVFITVPETKDELSVEFELLESKEAPAVYRSNGILMAAPLSMVDVNVDKLQKTVLDPNMVLKLSGAYHEEHKILTPDETSDDENLKKTLRFYVNRDLETDIGVTESVGEAEVSNAVGSSTVSLKSLLTQHDIQVSLPLGEDTVDVQLRAENCQDESLRVRLDFDIPPEEKEFLKKRRVVVAQALEKALDLSCPAKKVPVIAAVCSGGGTRAMTGLYGSLRGLQRIGLLDAVSYITGVSGSTWAMAKLYEDTDWSKRDMGEFISELEGEITKSFLSSFSAEQLQYYRQEMAEKEKEGHLVSLIDMWGLVIEHIIYGKKNTSTLSGQQSAVSEGQNPLPIFTAVNMKDGIKGSIKEAEWCEFTPYEVGIPKYGAFVHSEDFGSEFYIGHMVKKLPETRLPYLIGLWSSVFSLNLTQLWGIMTGAKPTWSAWIGDDVDKIEVDDEPTTLDTYLLTPVTKTAQMITGFLKNRPVINETYNFMRGFFLHWNYSDNKNFSTWKDKHPDTFPNKLTPTDSILHLVDSGFTINTGCPPVLRPQRAVDVIISFSYSWDPDVFNVLRKTELYCKDHKLHFPRIDYSRLEAEPLRELYVIEDEENPNAPIVLHFPLVNVSYKEFKAPGVAREGEEEMKAGDVDVSSSSSPYITKNITYSAEDYQAIVDLTSYNVQNNKDQILEALRRALDREVPLDEP